VSPIPDKQTMLEALTTAALALAEAIPLERKRDSLLPLKELSALDLALIGGGHRLGALSISWCKDSGI
jgi:hypothetical protein